MKNVKKKVSKSEAKLTERQLSALNRYNNRKVWPKIKLNTKKSDEFRFSVKSNNSHLTTALLLESVGTTDEDFLSGITRQIHLACPYNQENDFNFLFSVVKGVEPRDQLEAMLAAQMGAVHMTTMFFARRLAMADTLYQQDSAERTFNKLARTFATQMEALKRYRSGGEQKITVHRVWVSDGGQAIVGNVTQAEKDHVTQAEKEKSFDDAAPAPIIDSRIEPMPALKRKAAAPIRRGTKK